MKILVTALLLVLVLSAQAKELKRGEDGVFSVKSPSKKVNLLELYTSEGCSSCPPADRWISEYMGSQDLWNTLIPLSFHVDYWDYIGWKDRFAKPFYAQRQRQLKENGQTESVYTPQFVYNGDEWRGFFKRWFGGDELPNNHNKEAGVLALTVLPSGKANAQFDVANNVKLSQSKTTPPQLLLHIALVASDVSSEITNGENRGKRLDHDFVVLNYQAYLSSGDTENIENNSPILWPDIVAPAIPKIASEADKLAWVAWVTLPGKKGHYQAAGGWIK